MIKYIPLDKYYFMFEQILQEVKEKLGNNPAIAENIPAEHADAIHQEIAEHIHNGVQDSGTAGASGGVLSQLENSLTSGNILTSAVAGGLIGSLGRRFGLSSAVTGAIAASLPGLIQKFTNKTTSPAAAIAQPTIPGSQV
jgi:uncharacterized protein YidB (DUF937 family)